ncbi:XdhC family protein [Sphingobium estronivorans]|uniref:XdhC family protein n=1 Tax=Sphingobium estronivorans TaxID=1577690 RepID=UPI0013C3235F|nr:XdhC family protein [Sphingobium estronivorans]
MDDHEIFARLKKAEGRWALVTLVTALGSSVRAPGAHMAVCEDGRYVGSFSGGCIERAVAAEAVEAIRLAEPRLVRFGQGSSYIDIRLPCGGGVDLHFQPWDFPELDDRVEAALTRREPFGLDLFLDGSAPAFIAGYQPTVWDMERRVVHTGHWPRPRLLIVGHGAAVARLADQGRAWGAEIAVRTPDADLVCSLRRDGHKADRLEKTSDVDLIQSDAWTAIIFLFHDHDWERFLLADALNKPHFFVGAMGSRRAHKVRVESLLNIGVDQDRIDTIQAPIGLFHSARDPSTLAVSVLAQVADAYRRAHFAFSLADVEGTQRPQGRSGSGRRASRYGF